MADCPSTRDGYHRRARGVDYVEKNGKRVAVVYYYCTACGVRL